MTPTPSATPSCQISGGSFSCAGVSTVVSFSATTTGAITSFDWSHDCGPTANLTNTLGDADLDLSDPGIGKAVACTVTLEVKDAANNSAICDANVDVDPCVLDCLNQINGTAKVDRCSVCNGDGTSCLGCTSQNIKPKLFSLDGAAFDQKNTVRDAARLLAQVTKNHKAGSAEVAEAFELYNSSWNLAWSMPEVNVQCTNSQFCVSVDNVPTIEVYTSNADRLLKLAKGLARKARKLGNARQQRSAKQIIKRAKHFYDNAITDSKTVPQTYDACSS